MIIGYDGSRINVKQRTGTENYSYQLLKNLLQIDANNSYRIYSRQKISDPALMAHNVHHEVIGMTRLWTQLGLAVKVIKQQPDLLFIPAHTLPVLRRPSLNSVVTIHDLGAEYLPQYHTFPSKLYLNKATEYAARYATHLIAVSEFTKKDLIKKMNVEPERVTVVYEGVDLTDLSPSTAGEVDRVKKKYKLHRKYILFVGTIQPRKNLVKLIEAYAELLPEGVDLALAGGKGWLSDEIYQAPARLGIKDRVKFLGYIDESDKAGLYTGASLTALVSLFEGFGLPVIESMACGTPVVASDASSLPEVVGDAGVLVDPYDTQSISQGLHQVLTDKSLRKKIVHNGQAQSRKFSWEKAAEQTLQVFEKVASQ